MAGSVSTSHSPPTPPSHHNLCQPPPSTIYSDAPNSIHSWVATICFQNKLIYSTLLAIFSSLALRRKHCLVLLKSKVITLTLTCLQEGGMQKHHCSEDYKNGPAKADHQNSVLTVRPGRNLSEARMFCQKEHQIHRIRGLRAAPTPGTAVHPKSRDASRGRYPVWVSTYSRRLCNAARKITLAPSASLQPLLSFPRRRSKWGL